MKIFLIVDDSPVIRKVAKRIIEDLGFVVLEAASADDAQTMCMDNMPDGIMLDWDMPGMSSIDFLNWLRDFPDGEKAKTVYCTSEVMVVEMMKAKRAGAIGFLLKPFNRRLLTKKFLEIGLISAETAAA